MLYVFNEWFLLKIAKYIVQRKIWLAIEELRRLMRQWLFLILQEIIKALSSISGWRLILQVLKRIGCIIKTGLKYIFFELPVPALECLYILHLVRAVLTLIDFVKGSDNKNLVEITKFLYALFKVLISLVMLGFLIVLLIPGLAPLGLVAYAYIKILFRAYTFSKFGISLLTLGFSYYKTKVYSDDAEHAWLLAQYRANIQKHTHILVLGTLITALLTVVSLVGFGLGPIGLAVVIALGCLLLIVDIAKAIYFYKYGCAVPEPEIGSLPQQNSLIDFSTKDYYYRKCRTARLKINDLESNRIYLLKEIVVKTIQLETKLKIYSQRKCSFFQSCFSEKQKIQDKITGLIEEARALLKDQPEKLSFAMSLLVSLQIDIQEIKESPHKTLVTMDTLQAYIQGLKSQLQQMKNGDTVSIKLILNSKNNKLWELIFTEKPRDESILYLKNALQSPNKDKADFYDLRQACLISSGDSVELMPDHQDLQKKIDDPISIATPRMAAG